LGEFATAGEREALVAGTLVVKAGDNFKFVVAPGVIIEKTEEEHGGDSHDAETSLEGSSRETRFVTRVGVGYSFELRNVVLTPIAYFDLLEGSEDAVDAHLIFGVSIAFPF